MRKAVKAFESTAQKYDETTRTLLLPAIDGQEAGVFLEMVAGPNPWHEELDKTSTPLPMPLPALLLKHQDKSGLVKALRTYSEISTQLYESMKEFAPKDSPVHELEWKTPTEEESDAGFSYRSTLSDWGLSEDVQWGAFVSDDTMVLNFYQGQAEALSTARKTSLFGPVTAGGPAASLMFYDNRVVMNGFQAWADIARDMAEDQSGVEWDLSSYEAERDTLQFSGEQMTDHMNRVWDMMKCWQGFSLRSFPENGGTGSEFLLKFEDVAGEE